MFCGRSNALTCIYDPVANTMVAGPTAPSNVNSGGHSFQLRDGRYVLVNGAGGTSTALYDAGWIRTGAYASEALHPADINWWNTFSWVRDTDDTLTTKLRTAFSAGALAAAAWRTVANGGAIAPGVGETWLQLGADLARAIPSSSGALQDVWAPWAAELRAFFADESQVQHLAGPMRQSQVTSPDDPTTAGTSAGLLDAASRNAEPSLREALPGLVRVVSGHDVRVAELGDGFDFAAEPFDHGRPLHEVGVNQL